MSTPGETAAFLRRVRILQGLTQRDLLAVAERLGERKLRKGQVLFREGDAGEEMFLVRHGTILVSKAVTGRVEQVLARIGEGDFFGEMSLFGRAPRSATVQADTEVLLLVLDRENLQRLIDMSPRAAAVFFQGLVHVFIERLRASGDLVAEVTRWGLEATGLDVETP